MFSSSFGVRLIFYMLSNLFFIPSSEKQYCLKITINVGDDVQFFLYTIPSKFAIKPDDEYLSVEKIPHVFRMPITTSEVILLSSQTV